MAQMVPGVCKLQVVTHMAIWDSQICKTRGSFFSQVWGANSMNRLLEISKSYDS